MTKKFPHRYLLLLIVLVVLVFGFISSNKMESVAARMDDPSPSPTPKSAEVLKLEEEKAQATLRKEIAEANKAEREAKFPKPSTSPLAGTTTINDGAVIESHIIAYHSLAKSANRIIAGINTHTLPLEHLAIYNERDINLFLSYKVANTQISSIQDQYCKVLDLSETPELCAKPSPIPACPSPSPSPKANATPKTTNFKVAPAIGGLAIAQSFLGAFVDFTALLRTNVDIKGISFDIDEGPLVAEVFRAARRSTGGLPSGVNLYYPHVFPPDLNPTSESPLLQRLEDIHKLRIKAGKLVSDLEKTQKDIEESEATIKQLKGSKKALEKQEGETETAINNLFRANFCSNLAQQSIDILEKVNRVVNHRACPRMSAETRERMLQLAETVKDLRTKLSKTQNDLTDETTKLSDLKDKFEKLKDKLSSDFQPGGTLDDALAQLKAFNANFDSLVKSLVEVDAASGANPLTNYIRVENLMGALPFCGSYWLQLKVLKAGGNNRIKTNLITDIFTAGNRVSHSGGVIVQYHLFDAAGRSVASDTIADYTNYIKANKIKDLPTADVDEGP
jgi:hypothetical protein